MRDCCGLQNLCTEGGCFPLLLLKPTLTERVQVAEAAAKNKSVFGMKDTAAIAEFNAVYAEIAKRIGMV